MRKIRLETHKYYHVYNRGAGKQTVFIDDRDKFRFLRKIWELNNRTTSGERDYLLRELQTDCGGQENLQDKLGLGYPKPSLS